MLQKQNIDINLAQGIETQVDSKVLEGKNLIVENASFNKFQALQKNKGYAAFGMDIEGGGSLEGAVKQLFNLGKQIMCVTEDREYYAYYPVADNWRLMTGCKFPAKIESFDLNYQGKSQNFPDMAYNSTLNVSATVYEESDAVLSTIAVVLVIRDHTTGSTIRTYVTSQGRGPRVHIVESGGVYKVLVICRVQDGTVTSGNYYHFYDLELNLLSGPTVIATSGADSKINSDQSGSTVAFIFETGTADVGYGTITYSGTLSFQALNSTNNMASGYGPKIRFVGSQIWLAWIGTGDLVIFKAYESDLTTVAIAETLIKDYSAGTDNPFKVDFLKKTSGVEIYIEVESPDNVVATNVRYIEALSYDSAVSVLASTHRIYNCFFQSEIYYDSTNDKRYALIGYDSPLQKTNFFCELELAVIASSNVLYTHVLAQTTKGLASGVVTVSVGATWVPSKLNYSGGVFYIPSERTRDFITETSAFFDASAIEHLAINIDDFKMQFKPIGKSVLMASGIICESDGVEVLENGFLINPELIDVAELGAGTIGAGTRGYKVVWEYFNSKGELCRSAPSNAVSFTQTGASKTNTISIQVPTFGQKVNYRAKPALYRTAAAGTVYYRLTTAEATSSVNPYALFMTIQDSATDASLTGNEILYTTGGELPTDAAPQGTAISVGNDRAVIAGLKMSNEIGYSKNTVFEVSPEFSDFYRVDVNAANFGESGKVYGAAHLDNKIILFKESSVYYMLGNGPNNAGLNDDFTKPEQISDEVGCVENQSIINIPQGILFKSKKGFYLLDRGLNLQYVGSAVNSFNDYTVTSSLIIEGKNEAKFFLDESYTLTYHYLLDQWAVDTFGCESAIIANSLLYFVKDGDIYKESTAYTRGGDFYDMKVRTPWIKLNTLQGFQRIWRALVTGEYKSSHTLYLRIYHDYDTTTYEQHSISVSAAGPYSLLAHIGKQKCSAIMFEIFDNAVSGGESMELNTLTLEVGIKKGAAKIASAKRF